MLSVLMRVIGRLSVGRKLILIYALDLSAVLFVSGILISEKFIAIDFARKEIIGNQYIAVVRDALFSFHLDTASTRSHVSKLRAADTSFGNMLDSSILANTFADLLSNADNRKIAQATLAGQALITRIGNQSNLILDPDLDSYYTMSLIVLRFPELFELVDLISKKTAERMQHPLTNRNRIQTEYLLLEGRLDAIDKGIDADFTEAIAAGKPEFKAPMLAAQNSLHAAINLFRENAHQIVIDGIDGAKAPDMAKAAQALLVQQSEAWNTAGTLLEQLLEARVNALFQRMWLHLGTAALLLSLILGVVYFVARQIVLPLSRLSKVADQVRQSGNYDLRAEWQSGDELGNLVNSFNVMLEQLNHSRLLEQEMAASQGAAAAQRELLEAIPIPMVVTSIPTHDVLHSNLPAQSWLEGRTTDPWLSGLSPQARVRFFQQLSDCGVVNEFEVLWQGEKRRNWALISARRLNYQDKDAVLTTFTPINSLKIMEQHLAFWAKVFEASSESIMVTDAEHKIVTVNRAFVRTTGYEVSEVVGLTPSILRSDKHPDDFIDEIWRLASMRGSWQGELWLQRKSGEVFPLRTVVNSVRDERSQITHFIAVAHDISEHKANEQRISHLAHHDVLTDLPNRSLCIERLRMSIQQAERQHHNVGVLFIDLDQFKQVNDSLGHSVGDELLVAVAARLDEHARLIDMLARLGGDEFICLMEAVRDDDEVAMIAEEIAAAFEEPFQLGEHELFLSASIGISLYPADGDSVVELMRNADSAMYRAKASGRGRYHFYTPEMTQAAQDRIRMENLLRRALENGELSVHLQPQVDAGSSKLVGAEALVRWFSPELGNVPPGQFIKLAEESGIIIKLGSWVLREACRQVMQWRMSGFDLPQLSVNLSVKQLERPEFIDTLDDILCETGMDPHCLKLEITESVVMAVGNAFDLLDRLRGLCITLSLDDFGTGYSSLSYLKMLPVLR